jgi:serine protease AprX
MRGISYAARRSARGWTWAARAAAGLSALVLVLGAIANACVARADATGPLVPVIVQYGSAGPDTAAEAVERAGGKVGRGLHLVHGFAAEVPAEAVPGLRRAPGIRQVTPDEQVRLKGGEWRADKDANSLYSITKSIGAQDAWMKTDPSGRRVTGKGVGVALIDSGIAPVTGLADPAKVINGPDLSFESQASNLRHLDTFGHGTHLAGIILGRDPNVRAGSENDPRNFVGVAPDAHLVNLKVAAANGATDVSQVIAAIDWVVAHRNDPGLNIRVLNLSFGTDSVQDARLDPLSHAVEAAWRHGIVVVVAVGNDGATARRVSMPAANPYVIAVGAADPHGTGDRRDDTVADFSTRGSATRHADLVAPGKSVVSLRDPNSYIDQKYPTGLIAYDPEQRFFRGSGTSQATAVVSGAAALLLQQRPDLTPDQVKRLLTGTAESMPTADSIAGGAGQLDIGKAVGTRAPASTQVHAASLGTGSLEQSRGTAHVADPTNGVELTGEQDIMGQAWNAQAWSAAASAGSTWSGGTWNGQTWSGDGWSGVSWAGQTWSGQTWSGQTWSGQTWSGQTWSGQTWSGQTWSGQTWSGQTWSGQTWSGQTWSNDYWSSSEWR